MRGFVTKKGRRYYVVVEEKALADGKRRRRWHSGYDTKREAENALAEIVQSVNSGTYVRPTDRTVEQYLVREWLPAVKASIKPTTFASYQRNITNHVVPGIGHIRLQALTVADLNAWYGWLAESGRRSGDGGLSGKTIRYLHTIVRKALSDALSWNFIARNVAAAARPPRVDPDSGVRRTWTSEQLRQFLTSVQDDRLDAAWTLLATTGMRRGEVLGLHWEDVDVDAGTVRIHRTLVSVEYRLTFSTPKSARSRRLLQLDAKTVAALKRHRAAQLRERLAQGTPHSGSELVFTHENGGPLHPDRLTHLFNRHVKTLGMPRIRLHDLRHTYATLALEAGLNPRVVSDRLGHSNVAFTLAVYAHVLPSMDQEAADRVAALIFG